MNQGSEVQGSVVAFRAVESAVQRRMMKKARKMGSFDVGPGSKHMHERPN
jgi:hypothetical protein